MTTQGSRLRKIRQELKLSQDMFGQKIGVSKQYVSNLEADRNVLNNEKLVLLLVDFNVNLNYLVGGIGKMFNTIEPTDDVLANKVRKILREEGVI